MSDPEGEPLGGVLLWLKDGLLDGLEVYSYDSPLAIPSLGWVEWQLGRSDS